MLHHLVTQRRDEIVAETRATVAARECPEGLALDFEHGVPEFLTQLSDALVEETGAHSSGPIGLSATRHGAEMVAVGFSLSEVVHEYGDICQAVTRVALKHNLLITTQEFLYLERLPRHGHC